MAAKKSFYFKLSRQAEQHLNRIVSLTGVNKTAIVEMAIVKLSDSIKGENVMNDADTDAAYWAGKIEQLELGYNEALYIKADHRVVGYALGGDEMRALYEELAAAEINLEDHDYEKTLRPILEKYGV